MKFYSIGDFGGYDSVHRLLSKTFGWQSVDAPEFADVIVWNGGADIATEIYGERPIDRYIPEHKSPRDTMECDTFAEFKYSSKLKLGICRGAQLLNCLNGGRLYQDVNNHTRSHLMLDVRTGEELQVTSTHHQQMRAGPEATIIGIANDSTIKHSDEGVERLTQAESIRDGQDLEIVWYRDTQTLCIQGHPEYVPNSRFASYTRELIDSLYKPVPNSVEVLECVG